MSRQADEAKTVRGSKGNKPTQSKVSRSFLAFNPTKEETKALSEGAVPIEEALDTLDAWIDRGFKITIAAHQDRQAVYAVIRENTGNWKEDHALSCWHKTAEKALRGLAYALQGRYQDFPDCAGFGLDIEPEW